jgi:RNA polymerase sigma-70 factor, ECF subfamily
MTKSITPIPITQDFPTPDISDLIENARNDPQAFAELYQLYIQPVFRYLFSRIGSLPEAEDATAQTFLAILESLDRYHDDGHFAAWVFSIARRKAMDHFRSQRRQMPLEQAESVPLHSDLLQQAIQSQQNQALADVIRSLPEGERELIRLRYIANLSFSEIGRLLNRSEEASKKSLYRLLARLQSQLEDSHE